MAVMYPEFGPKKNSSPTAEPEIYELLKNQLDDNFHIIHSTPWLSSITENYALKRSGIGEVDFLIFHSKLGCLAVEVKGGRIHHDRSGFYYLRKNSDQKQSTDFFQQANRGRFALQDFLKKKGKSIKIGLAFFLNECEVEQALLPPHLIDINRNIPLVFDIKDTNGLGEKITNLMEYYANTFQQPTFSDSDLQQIIDHILPTANFGPCWTARINNDEVFWLKMTEEQIECTEFAVNQHRTIITGWPGSGKTIVGIAAARQLSNSGKKILFLTFNELLTRKIYSQLDQHENCTVKSFHQLCGEAERHTGEAIISKDKEWYEKGSASSLSKAIDSGFLDSFDTLIVDESQIIRPTWWEVLLLKFDDQHIIAMCDETQAFTYETKTPLSVLEKMLDIKHYLLTQSLRTPKHVCNKLKSLIPPNYSITNPRPIEDDTYQERITLNFEKSIVELIDELARDNIPPSHVTFLVEYKTRDLDWLIQLDYTVETIGRFRGVESPIIVVLAKGEVSDTTLFCAYSRCTSRCIVIAWAGDIATEAITQVEPGTVEKANSLYETHLFESSFGYKIQSSSLKLHTIDIELINFMWCEEWKGYLLYTHSPKNIVWHMWKDLIMHCPSSLYICENTSKEQFHNYLPYNEENGSIKSDITYIDDCLKCQHATPHHRITGKETCTICEDSKIHPERSLPFEKIQRRWNDILLRKKSLNNDEKKSLPLPLFSILSLSHQNLLENEVVIQLVNEAYGEKYKWILCLLIVVIYRTNSSKKSLTVRNLMDKLKKWNKEIEKYGDPSLSGRISSSLEKLDRLKITAKTGKKGERKINFESQIFIES